MMQFDFTDKVVFVTGGSMGIGEAICKQFAEAGAKVAVAGRNMDNIQRVVDEITAAGGTAIPVPCDIRKEEDVKAAVQKTLDAFGGRLDILVNNAGVVDSGLVEKKSLEEWNRVIDTDLTGTFLCTREVMPIMKKQHFGRIIIIGSIVGKRTGILSGVAYTAAKAGQIGFSHQCAVEGAPFNVTCNVVNPGSTLTPLQVHHTPAETLKNKAKMIPAGRLGTPEDMANATLFFASEYANYINGAHIDVDGAWLYNYVSSEKYYEMLGEELY